MPLSFALTHNDVRLRIVRIKDAKALEKLVLGNREWLRPWEATNPDGPTSFDIRAQIRGLLKQMDNQTGLPFVIEIDGELVGFAHLRRHSDTFTGGPAWFLDDLFTAPAARGHGVATALIAALRAHADANGGGTISWITADDNLTAQRVYDKVATRTRWVTYELDS